MHKSLFYLPILAALALVPAVLAIAPTNILDTGTSSSGTPGTLIAQIDAGAGNQLVSINGFYNQASGINTQTRFIATYTDATTTTQDSPALTATSNSISNAGILRNHAVGSVPIFFDETKKIQKLRVETLGTGTDSRWAGLFGVIVPVAGWPEVFNSLINNMVEAAGANCIDGGTKTITGLDDGLPTGTANNMILESGEIDFTFYTCRGRDAGIRYRYDSSTIEADPGAGDFRFNNADLTMVTALYVSETDGDSASMGAWLNDWDLIGGNVKGTLFIFKNNAPSTFAAFQVVSTVMDNGGWDSMSLAFLAGEGTFANNDAVKFHYVPTGGNSTVQTTTIESEFIEGLELLIPLLLLAAIILWAEKLKSPMLYLVGIVLNILVVATLSAGLEEVQIILVAMIVVLAYRMIQVYNETGETDKT